jgi:hypothetical protein
LFNKVNYFFLQILIDIEERAPAMKRQRDEYEHAMASLKSLEQMLEEERDLNSTYKQEADTNRHRLATAGRDNERLKRQVRICLICFCYLPWCKVLLLMQVGFKLYHNRKLLQSSS